MMRKNQQKLIEALGPERVKVDESLNFHTTFKIGGPAKLYFEAKTAEELREAILLAHKLKIPFFILGGGSNILVSDQGFKGLVIRCAIKTLKIVGKSHQITSPRKSGISRYEDYRKEFLSFSDLDYPDPPLDTRILVGSGVSLAYLIDWSLKKGLTGLEWFSGIPGSVGGAIYNNIHGGNRLLLSRVEKLYLLTRSGEKRSVGVSYLEAGYDYTVLQKRQEIIVKAEFRLSAQGDLKKAKKVADLWRERKAQVQLSANCPGCIFKNISQVERKRLGWPTTSVGYIFDKLLDWKGKVGVGEAAISEKHGNFIVNKGGATAKEVISLMKKMQTEVKKRYGIKLNPEIFFVGFEKDPLG